MKHKHNILIVDDEINNVNSLKIFLKKKYNVFTAQSGQEGLEIIQTVKIHVTIADQRMPIMSGVEFLRSAKEINPDMVAIIMTAFSDIDLIIEAINDVGIYHYIQKPIDIEDLKVTVNNAIETFDLRMQNRELILNLTDVNKYLEAEIEKRTEELEEKNIKLRDSLMYAQGIQNVLLPLPSFFKKNFREHFVLYKPKDLVSGDFYWSYQHPEEEKSVLIVADCTGHGVPGAMLSMLGMKTIDSLVHYEKNFDPADILFQLHVTIRDILKQNITGNADGMDAAVIMWDKKKQVFRYSGAKAPIILFKNGTPIRISGDNKEIGGVKLRGSRKKFQTQEFKVEEGDRLYMFSDGFTDQFGGPLRQKFMARRFLELLESVQRFPMKKQKQEIWTTMQQWMREGNERQLDDMTIVGLTF